MWLVELAPLSEGELVPQAVAGALEIQEQPGQPLIDTLVEALRDKRCCLCWTTASTSWRPLLGWWTTSWTRARSLRVLATSREALDMAGEVRLAGVPAFCARSTSIRRQSESWKGTSRFGCS